jgi:Ca-activated chloride channel family protein
LTFERPVWSLLLLLVPVLWLSMRRWRGSRLCLALKCAASAALIIALAGPSARMPVHRLGVTMVLDTSASMSREARQRAERLLADIVSKQSNATLQLVTFSGTAHLEAIPPRGTALAMPAEGVDSATDIEAGLQLALNSFPQEGVHRVVLVSDGNENRGNALTAALRARQQSVVVFSLPSGGSAGLPVHLDSANVPQHVFSGERFVVSLRVGSLRAHSARLSVMCQGQQIASAPLELQSGSNPLEIEARIAGSGVSVLEVRLVEGDTERVLLSQAVTVNRPRVLYVAGGRSPATPLLETLKRADIDIETEPSFPTEPASGDWDTVILDDYPDGELPPDEHAALIKYVTAGGGLIVIFGERNAQLSEEPHTPLEKLLPVRGEPETPEKPTAVVLVVDKSQSMSGPKIQMARAAARDSVMTLRPTDRIGIIEFNDKFRWVVPIQTIADLPQITTLIDSIRPDGSTQIYPPLQAAFEAIREEKVTGRHIILLTDGVSPPGDMARLIRAAAAQHVSISTVGIGGADVNQQMLQDIATGTQGRSYLVEDAETLPQVVSGETQKLKATLLQETRVRARLVQPVEFTDGVDFKQSPQLLGFVKVKAKRGAETILRTDTGKPLLVRWQYGLGRVNAFMSDARNRWAVDWLAWDGFGTLWPQMVRDVSSPDRRVRAALAGGTRDGRQTVTYDVLSAGGLDANPDFTEGGTPRIVVASPEKPARSLALEETSPHHFEALIPASQQGLYTIAADNSGLRLPLTGFYRESEELRARPPNVELLGQISTITGGALNPTVEQLLDETGTLGFERRPLWPYWIALAVAINFIELASRKGHLRRWRSRLSSVPTRKH